ncbi:hypothetical protein EDC96DRAFT_499046 [Choanephora cucurbitarum]|nr:hypothetical protein EDC96DRAFT_499046 [Choanephora cucurbitarum]
MMNSLIGARNNHLDFNILFYPQYQNEHGQVVCHPGSVFEGIVQVKVGVPIQVHHIKLVFKASERVNYDAMGWEKSKLTDDRLFAVRTILWGLPAGVDVPPSAWPILEAGEYTFPFVCQMPMINFPPTFHHHLIATAFNMIVSVDKANETTPILSKPFPVQFQPTIETIPIKNLHAFTETSKLTNHVNAQVSVPRLAYNVNDANQAISVTIQFSSLEDEQSLNMSQLRVYLKRYYSINYKSFSRSEATIVAHYDHPKLPSTCPSTVNMKLNLPSNQDELPATLVYSPHLTIEYKLVVVAKVRHGPIHIKKKLFDLPVMFGTLPAGTRAPRLLEPYSAIVENRSSMHSKPQFIRPEPRAPDEEEFLPPYNSDSVPPAYNNLLNNANLYPDRTASTSSLRIQIY